MIYLKKVDGGRSVVIEVNNGNSTKYPEIYQSRSVVQPQQTFNFIGGVNEDVGSNMRVIYSDSMGDISTQQIASNSSFNFGVLPINLFENNTPYTGSIQPMNLAIYNNSSPAIYRQ